MYIELKEHSAENGCVVVRSGFYVGMHQGPASFTGKPDNPSIRFAQPRSVPQFRLRRAVFFDRERMRS